MKIKLEEVTFIPVGSLNPSRWRSPSASGCRLKDNRPTESFWQNTPITLVLPFVCLSVSMWLSLRDKLALCSHTSQIWCGFFFFQIWTFSFHCPRLKSAYIFLLNHSAKPGNQSNYFKSYLSNIICAVNKSQTLGNQILGPVLILVS